MSDTDIKLKITSEAIIRCSTISLFDLFVIQVYIIKKILKTRVTKDLVNTVYPDNDAVYIAIFELPDMTDTSDTSDTSDTADAPIYKICHFVFDGISHGFITKNGSIMFIINNDILEKHVDNLESIENDTIYNWFKDRIKYHTYLDFSSIFYLSN